MQFTSSYVGLIRGDKAKSLFAPWDVVATHIESLPAQLQVLALFDPMKHATSFRERVYIPRMASLSASNRLKCVLRNEEEKKLSLIEYDEDGNWIVLGKSRIACATMFASHHSCRGI